MDKEDVVCVYIYKMEYSAIKKNEIMSSVATWMDLEIVILSEVSQTEKRQILYGSTTLNYLKLSCSCSAKSEVIQCVHTLSQFLPNVIEHKYSKIIDE